MFTKTPFRDGLTRLKCDCGHEVAFREDVPRRHRCALTGELATYWPDGFDAAAYTARRKEKPAAPSLIQRAKNFRRAEKAHRAAGRPKATDDQVAERFAICASDQCGLFRADGEGKGTCLHTSCGCNLRTVAAESKLTPNKLRWAEQKCPKGLWPATSSAGTTGPPRPPGL